MTSFAPIVFSLAPSPIGEILLVAQQDALVGLYMETFAHGPTDRTAWIRDDARLAAVRAQLDEYFAGKRTSFDLPLRLEGTPFQQRVWDALCAIPFGETVSYGELAARIGAPGSARAVGHSNARNPVSIVVPCHRVIGADGSLTGYGGGEPRKRWLLEWERGVAR
jgi:methylated-DNA-[protein]-cysteine S-methyltransferase